MRLLDIAIAENVCRRLASALTTMLREIGPRALFGWSVPQRQPELSCHTGCPLLFGTFVTLTVGTHFGLEIGGQMG